MAAAPHVASRLYNVPLMISPAKLSAIVAGLAPRLAGQVGAFRPGSGPSPVASGRPYTVTRGIAVIEITGIPVHRAGRVDPTSSPLRSYPAIRADLVAALADPAVRAVVLDLNSCGGEVAGLDLATAIYKLRGRKPMIAVANFEAVSAGYAIAAAADAVFVPPSGTVGGVGIVAVHRDQSERDRMDGLKYTMIAAGERKADGSPHAPLSDRARAALTADMEFLHNLFVDQVARHRGMTAAAVRATKAGTFLGQAAVALGLADRLGTFDDAMREAARRVTGSRSFASAGGSAAPARAAAVPPRALAGPRRTSPYALHPSRPGALPPVPDAPPPPPRPPMPPAPPPAPQPGALRGQAAIDAAWAESVARVCGAAPPAISS